MSGILSGIGVGPGDPELMTLKAVRKIQECDVIAVPVSDPDLTEPVYAAGREADEREEVKNWLSSCVAYQIAMGAVPEITGKEKLYLPMPMIKEKEKLSKIHDLAADAVGSLLKEEKKIVFLTLGDPTVYSTCMYVYRRIRQQGFATELIPGIPSFCAAAARLNDSLAEKEEELHVIPASYGIEKSLELSGTKVLMKSGRKISEVKRILREKNAEVRMVENCGMKQEKVYTSVDEIPETAGYYSLLIVKEKRADRRVGTYSSKTDQEETER